MIGTFNKEEYLETHQPYKGSVRLFHLPASALRYWDDEGLIRFERSKDNHYRCPTSQTMLDICDVIFYRSLSLSIKEIKSIPGMCVEDVDHTLDIQTQDGWRTKSGRCR